MRSGSDDEGGVSRSEPRLRFASPVALVFVFVAAWTSLPWVVAEWAPPPGREFVGVFHWTDDIFNYFSYLRQAEDGALVFDNRLRAPGRAALVNLEWWAMGVTSRALGRRPAVAFRLWGLVFALVWLGAFDVWLRRAGLPDDCRVPALLLAATGGGLGGVLFTWTDLPVRHCLDLFMGLFPFMEMLANPHFLAGTALLTASLVALLSGRTAWGVTLGCVLGLTRPYDLGLLGLLAGLAVLLGRPPRTWASGLAPLLALVPVLAYDVWVFFASPQFASFRGEYEFPPPGELLAALGPAAALAMLAARLPSTPAQAPFRRALWTWAAVPAVLAALRPGSFGQQLLVGSGAPLLALAALGLSRRGPRAVLAGAVVLMPTALVATRVLLTPDPHWFVPESRLTAARALDRVCAGGERVLAPPDIGLYALAYSACRPYVAHEAAPGYEQRLALVRAFYGTAAPAARRGFLERECVDVVALPGDPGAEPASWLGEDAPFVRAERVGDPVSLSWYTRIRPCRTGPGMSPEPR